MAATSHATAIIKPRSLVATSQMYAVSKAKFWLPAKGMERSKEMGAGHAPESGKIVAGANSKSCVSVGISNLGSLLSGSLGTVSQARMSGCSLHKSIGAGWDAGCVFLSGLSVLLSGMALGSSLGACGLSGVKSGRSVISSLTDPSLPNVHLLCLALPSAGSV